MLLIHWVFVFTILSIFTVMWWCRRFPSVDTVQQLATIINYAEETSSGLEYSAWSSSSRRSVILIGC